MSICMPFKDPSKYMKVELVFGGQKNDPVSNGKGNYIIHFYPFSIFITICGLIFIELVHTFRYASEGRFMNFKCIYFCWEEFSFSHRTEMQINKQINCWKLKFYSDADWTDAVVFLPWMYLNNSSLPKWMKALLSLILKRFSVVTFRRLQINHF